MGDDRLARQNLCGASHLGGGSAGPLLEQAEQVIPAFRAGQGIDLRAAAGRDDDRLRMAGRPQLEQEPGHLRRPDHDAFEEIERGTAVRQPDHQQLVCAGPRHVSPSRTSHPTREWALNPVKTLGSYPVTAPWLAEPTSLAYLPSTPVGERGSG